MKIEHLRLFISVIQSGSINKAAKETYISQQQLNNILTAMEEELRMPLLIRTHKGVRPTEAGKLLLEYAGEIINHYVDMQYKMNLMSLSGENTVQSKGVCHLHTPALFSTFLVDFYAEFTRNFPEIKLILYTDLANGKAMSELQTGHYYLDGNNRPDLLDKFYGKKYNSFSLSKFWIYLVAHRESPYWQSTPRPSYIPYVRTTLASIPLELFSENQILVYAANIHQLLDITNQTKSVCNFPSIFSLEILEQYPNLRLVDDIEPNLSQFCLVYSEETAKQMTKADKTMINFLNNYLQSKVDRFATTLETKEFSFK